MPAGSETDRARCGRLRRSRRPAPQRRERRCHPKTTPHKGLHAKADRFSAVFGDRHGHHADPGICECREREDGIARDIDHRANASNHAIRGLATIRRQASSVQARSRGGFTTKIHAKSDASGSLIAFDLTGGETADAPHFTTLLDIGPDIAPRAAIGDKGYSVNRRGIGALARSWC